MPTFRHISLLEAPDPGPLRARLETLYAALNRPEYIAPDPLQFVVPYSQLEDREIVGMIAAGLAFGNVKQILRSVQRVIDLLPEPYENVVRGSLKEWTRLLDGFRHRFVGAAELASFLEAMGRVCRKYESLGALFRTSMRDEEPTVLPALTRYVSELRSLSGNGRSYLLPDPSSGSACKRLHLFLRWMVRCDAVDPGGWDFVFPSALIVPLDTHLHRTARTLGLTRRKPADGRTALEVTAGFRCIAPEDPVRYDFALTRLGIRKDTEWASLLDGDQRKECPGAVEG